MILQANSWHPVRLHPARCRSSSAAHRQPVRHSWLTTGQRKFPTWAPALGSAGMEWRFRAAVANAV